MTSKNTPGYIRRYRRINLIWLAVWVVIGIAIFITGIMLWTTRANILTVMAVLMVLPGAKRIVALVAAGKKRSVSLERCKLVEEAVGSYIYGGVLDTHEYEAEELDEDEEDKDDAETEDESRFSEKPIPWSVIFTDYIFTSTEKIMMLDFLVVTFGTVFILPSSSNQDQEYVKKYLTEGIKKWSPELDIRFVWDDKKLVDGLKNLNEKAAPLRDRREVIAYLQSLAM